MKRLSIIFAIIPLLAFSQREKVTPLNNNLKPKTELVSPGYRNFSLDGISFGSSRDEVIKVLGEPIKKRPTYYFYKDKINLLKTDKFFYFHNNLLYQVGYTFIEEHTNENLFIDDFNGIEDLLIQKYGPTTKHHKKWIDDLYKDDLSKHGFAISLGDLTIGSFWQFDNFRIAHVLSGDNYNINHVLIYQQYPNPVDSQKKSMDKL